MKNQQIKIIGLIVILIACISIGILIFSPHKVKSPAVVTSVASLIATSTPESTSTKLSTEITLKVASTTPNQSSIETIVAAPALSLNVATGTAYEQVYALYITNHDIKKTIEIGRTNANFQIVKLLNMVDNSNVTLADGSTAAVVDVTFLTSEPIKAGDVAFKVEQ